jgi:transporter family protein
MAWLIYALASAVTAAATAILAKVGVEGVPSTVVT